VAARGSNIPLVYVDATDLPGAYVLAGRYSVEGGSVKVRVSLFKGEKETGNFTVEGNTADMNEVAAKIVGVAEHMLRDSN